MAIKGEKKLIEQTDPRTTAADRIRKAAKAEPAPAFKKPSGRASFPRRVTLDLDDDRYRYLRQVAYEDRSNIAEILRALVDVMREDEALRLRIVETVGEQAP